MSSVSFFEPSDSGEPDEPSQLGEWVRPVASCSNGDTCQPGESGEPVVPGCGLGSPGQLT